MEEEKVETQAAQVKLPAKFFLMMYCGRMGTILSNVAFTLICVSLASLASIFASIIVMIFGVLFVVCTLGMVLLIDGYWDTVMKSPEFVENVGSVLMNIGPTLSMVAVALSIASVVFLALDKTKPHTVRIIFACITVVLSIISFFALSALGI